MRGPLLKVKCSVSSRAGKRISIWFLESDGSFPLILVSMTKCPPLLMGVLYEGNNTNTDVE